MTNRKLFITHTVKPDLLDQIKSVIPDWEIHASTDPNDWEKHMSDAEIIIGWQSKWNNEKLMENRNVKWIQSWSAGVNSLPLDELAAKDIRVTSANGVHSFPISETVFALMLSLTRNIHTYVKNQQQKIWDDKELTLEIHEKTIGIIGVGAIGQETAKIAKAFGMKVIGVRHSGKEADFVDEMYKQSDLNTILPLCDYIVVTLPLTEETYHLFQKEQFSRMKDTAFFINIGRGEIVKEEDLAAALTNGEILGAGLDVFETEPLQKESPLWEMENVIITPHTSGSTAHYGKRVVEDIFIPNLKSYLNDGSLPNNLVNYKKGY
ncbi:D-2-hydroxyacid dehydrogenase [Niallia sp. 03133]|uniref:D-2-hydroxyacid dehydrogenase n=1 Tax=Niallia sp. 03133 TaxID=3458060 RepID=UPI00404490AB